MEAEAEAEAEAMNVNVNANVNVSGGGGSQQTQPTQRYAWDADCWNEQQQQQQEGEKKRVEVEEEEEEERGGEKTNKKRKWKDSEEAQVQGEQEPHQKDKEDEKDKENEKQQTQKRQTQQGGGGKSSSVFVRLLQECGCAWRQDAFEVEDVRKFRTKLELKLSTEPRARQLFLSDLEDGYKRNEDLKKLMKPMMSREEGEGGQQEYFDSLAHCLLNIYCIQSSVSSLLLERIPLLEAMDESQKELMKSILSQFRWLDVNAEEDTILEKLMEIMCVAEESYQKDIILFLPEITVTDEQAEKVGQFLLQKMEEDSNYTDAVIETISSLCISDTIRNEIALKILEQISAVHVDELCKIVKFLIENCTGETYQEIFMALRSQLHFVDRGDPRRKLPDKKQKGRQDREIEQAIIVAIKSAMRCKAEANMFYHKFLRSLEHSIQCCTLDVWVLTVLLSFGGDHASQAMQTLSKKLTSGQLTESTLLHSIHSHYKPLKEFFGTLQLCGSSLSKSKNRVVGNAGTVLYCALFQTFPELFQRQDVLGEIVGHLGSGNALEMDRALGALGEIAKKDLQALRPFTSYLATLLDHVDVFSKKQTRELFWVISELISPAENTAPNQQHSRLEDEVHILIRKQMSSNCVNHFQTGVIASLSLIERRERGIESSADPSKSSEEVCLMFKQMFKQCYRNPEILGFCFEEIAHSVSTGMLSHPRVLQYLNNMVTQDFENTFLEDLAEGKLIQDAQDAKQNYSMKGDAWFNLDGSDSPVAIKILPLSASCDKDEQLLLSKLPAEICMIQMLEKRLNKSLENIDALLGCPLHLFSRDCLDDISQTNKGSQNIVSRSLVSAINWIREILNAFTENMILPGDAAESEVRQEAVEKIVARCKNVCFLEACLILIRQKAMEKKGPLAKALDQTQKSINEDASPAKSPAKQSQARPKARFSLRDMNTEFEKSLKHFGLGQIQPLSKSNFNVLFLACSPSSLDDNESRSRIPVLAYLLLIMRDRCLSADGMDFLTSLDITDFRMEQKCPLYLPFVLKKLRDLFLRHLSEEHSSDQFCTVKSDIYSRATRLVDDSISASHFGLELVSDIICNTIEKCEDVEELQLFFTRFLLNREELMPNAVKDFLETMHAHVGKHSTFDHKFKVIQIIVTTYRKLSSQSSSSSAHLDAINLENLRQKTFLKVEELLTDTDPTAEPLNEKLNAKSCSKVIEQLVKDYSLLCNDPVGELGKLLMGFTRFVEEELGAHATRGQKADSPYPLLDRKTISAWYSALFHSFHDTFRIHLRKSKAAEKEKEAEGISDALTNVSLCATLFSKLVTLTRKVEKNHHSLFLRSILVYGQKTMEEVVTYLEGYNQTVLNSDQSDTFKQTLKELQKGTKIIHIICSECKTQKSSFLAAKVPALKRSVEKFVWKSREIFYKDESFTMGNLKHKNLRGEVVLSQLNMDNIVMM